MSKTAINFVFKYKVPINSSQRLVMYVLAAKYDDAKGFSQMTKKQISQHSSLAVKTVGRALTELIEAEIVQEIKTKSKKGNNYVFLAMNKGSDNKAMLEQMFNDFWQAYPLKKSKMVAKAAFFKLNPSQELAIRILEDLVDRMTYEWSLKEKQYIPHPSTYLNQHRWEDEIIKPDIDPQENGGFVW